MTNRQKFIDYVKNGGRPVCSPQIGTGAGFDTKLAGKVWITETTLEDTIRVTERFDMIPLFNAGVDVLAPGGLAWQSVSHSADAEKRAWESALETPYGTLRTTMIEQKHKGVFRTVDCVNGYEDLDAFEWLLDRILEGDYSVISENVASVMKVVADRGAVSFQWGMQPYELFSFPNTLNTMFLAMDYEERFFSLMEKCLAISARICESVAKGGADFCFLGGPAAEMVNFDIYDRFMVPYGKRISDVAHNLGLLIYSHVCSPVEPFLNAGYFNRLGIDLFETLSMPPVGNVKSIEDAFAKLDPAMCTRGNVGLDRLINATPDEIRQDVEHIMRVSISEGRKHMIAASDYLMTECKEENVRAMCDAVREFRG